LTLKKKGIFPANLKRWLVGMRKTTGVEDSALDILRKRYARGEINKEGFEQKKRDLV
jgi:putative membrane protein